MKKCAWISRHQPLTAQRKSLADYQIIQINPPGPRLLSAADAIALSQTACGGWPDLFVVVMPVLMLKQFCERVNGHVPIVRSVVKPDQNPSWSGHWEQVLAIQFVTQEWLPNRKEVR